MTRPARRFGSYQLIERLGRGGMGEVWRAQHDKLGRQAAIKLIRPEALTSTDGESRPSVVKRFEREAKATAGLTSPHTIRLFDFGSDDEGSFYYVMELLVGLGLETLVDRFGPVEPARVVHFLTQICDSLAEAHERNLIHRDIKPANIYTCRQGLKFDFVKVLDFGLVKPLPSAGRDISQLTVADATTGTPAFMAPELALGKEPFDGRTDIYALGCVAYWLLTHSLVFEASSAMQMVVAHVQETPDPPSARSEIEIPPDLEAVIMDCLAKSPEDRPASALELQQRLIGCNVGEPWTSERSLLWWHTHVPDLTDLHASDKRAVESPHPQTVREPIAAPAPAVPAPSPKPRTVPKVEPKHVRAVPAELSVTRHEVLHQLRNNFAHSVIDIDEFERRTEMIQSAVSLNELHAVVDDLPKLDSDGAALVPKPMDELANPPQISRVPSDDAEHALVPQTDAERALAKHRWRRGKRVFALLSGVTRKGQWEPASNMKIVTVLGGANLDFRQAKLQPGLTEIRCFAVLGGAEIIVPPDLPVFVDGFGFLGAFDDSKMLPPPEDHTGPMLRISGFAFLGGIDVKTKAIGEEDDRALRKRMRLARKHKHRRFLE